MGAWIYAISSGGAVTTYRRVCGLCGRPFAIYLPPGDQEKLMSAHAQQHLQGAPYMGKIR